MLAARRSLWRQAATVATPVVSGGIHHAPVRNLPPFLMRGNASAPPFSTMVLIANAQCPAMRVLVPKNSAAAFKNSTKYSKRSPLTTRFSTSSPSSPAGSNSGSQKVVAVVEKSMTQFERLKDLWRKYGIVAIGTYFSMYGIVLGSIYLAIDQGWVSTSKPSRSDSEDPENSEFNVVTATNKYDLFCFLRCAHFCFPD